MPTYIVETKYNIRIIEADYFDIFPDETLHFFLDNPPRRIISFGPNQYFSILTEEPIDKEN